MRGHWMLKEKALDWTMWKTHFGRGYGPVIRQTTKGMNEFIAHVHADERLRN